MVQVDRYGTIGQTHQHERTTDRYEFIPTNELVDVFASMGWVPNKIQEASTKKYQGYQKHLIRFRQENQEIVPVGGLVPEIVFVNSHHGGSSLQLKAGIYRLLCSNGLIAGDDLIPGICLRHSKKAPEALAGAIANIGRQLPLMMDRTDEMSSIVLTKNEQGIYAHAAAKLRFEEEELGATGRKVIHPENLLRAKRYGDQKDDLFTVFNRVQENMIKGVPGSWSRGKAVRGLKSIDKTIKLNQALWTLTEKMMEFKKAG